MCLSGKEIGEGNRGRTLSVSVVSAVSMSKARRQSLTPLSAPVVNAQVPLRYVSEPRRRSGMALWTRTPTGAAGAHPGNAEPVGACTRLAAEWRGVRPAQCKRLPNSATSARDAARWPTARTRRPTGSSPAQAGEAATSGSERLPSAVDLAAFADLVAGRRARVRLDANSPRGRRSRRTAAG